MPPKEEVHAAICGDLLWEPLYLQKSMQVN